MAIGDAAASAGMDVVASTDDARNGATEINRTRDYLARHMAEGTHPWDKISGRPNLVHVPTAQAITLRYDARPVVGHEGGEVEIPTRGELLAVESAASAASAAAGAAQGTANAAHAVAGGKADAFAGSNTVRHAQGPTGDAYGRTVVGGAFAVWMDASQQFGRNVSSERYKEDIQPHALDPAAVLALAPVTYHRIADPDEGAREYGLIAEEVAELVPEIVTYFDGQIDGVRYDLLAVALLDVVRHLEGRLAAVEVATAPPTPTPEEAI